MFVAASSLVAPARAALAHRSLASSSGRSPRRTRRRLATNPPRRALVDLVNAFRAYQARTETETRAREIASLRLRYPFQDPDADERRCLAALRALVAVYVASYTESDRLMNAEATAIFEAQGFLDRFDESQGGTGGTSESSVKSQNGRNRDAIGTRRP